MATLIKTDDTETTVAPKNPTEGFKLTELYDLMGCQIVQVEAIDDGKVMIIDEEGKLDETKQINIKATGLWARTHNLTIKSLIESGDHIVGDVIVCDESEFQ